MFLDETKLSVLKKVISPKISERQLQQIELYVQELVLYNSRLSLVKFSCLQDLFDNHILDSLLPLNYFLSLDSYAWADVGSGAGLPGLLLAIFMPNKHFTLIERSASRSCFLQTLVLRLKLKNVGVLERDVQDVYERFDVLTFRAFRPLELFSLDLKKLLKDQGLLLAYKGRIETAKTELKKVSSHFSSVQLKIFETTSQKERCLLVLSK